MSLSAYKSTIYADAASIIVFAGPPNVAVAWSLPSGPGTLAPLSNSTNALGVACAVYHGDGTPGQAVVRCTSGT